MIDPNAPAFPNPELGKSHFGDPGAYGGLTIRAHFAATTFSETELDALKDQFFAAHPDQKTVNMQQLRLFHADSLLAALNAEEGK